MAVVKSIVLSLLPSAAAAQSLPPRAQEEDEEMSGAGAVFVRLFFATFVGAAIYLIWRNHFRAGREGDVEDEVKRIRSDTEAALGEISASNALANRSTAGSNTPHRLTAKPPNHLARIVLRHARSVVTAERSSTGSKYTTCCQIVSGFFLWIGASMVVQALFHWESQAALLPIYVLIFGGAPAGILYQIKYENWAQLAPEAALEELGGSLDGRVQKETTSDLLKRLEPRPAAGERASTPGFLPADAFLALQRAGYASVRSWALYAAATERVASSFGDEGEAEFRRVHGKWYEDVLPRAAGAYARFTDGLDDTRRRARDRARRQAVGAVTGGIGDIMNVANDARDMDQAAKDMKAVMEDLKEIRALAQNASSVDADEVPTEEFVAHTEMHPLPRFRFLWGSFLIVFMLGSFALLCFNIDHKNRNPVIIGLMVFALFLVGLMYWITSKHSLSHNAIEDMVEVEILTRAAVEKALTSLADASLPAGDSEARELVAATAKLRQILMDNFYAALGIHAATDYLTDRAESYGGDAPMLFPREDDVEDPDVSEGVQWEEEPLP